MMTTLSRTLIGKIIASMWLISFFPSARRDGALNKFPEPLGWFGSMPMQWRWVTSPTLVWWGFYSQHSQWCMYWHIMYSIVRYSIWEQMRGISYNLFLETTHVKKMPDVSSGRTLRWMFTVLWTLQRVRRSPSLTCRLCSLLCLRGDKNWSKLGTFSANAVGKKIFCPALHTWSYCHVRFEDIYSNEHMTFILMAIWCIVRPSLKS